MGNGRFGFRVLCEGFCGILAVALCEILTLIIDIDIGWTLDLKVVWHGDRPLNPTSAPV